MRKCPCGNDVANNARSCPKCGHRFTSGLVKFLAWLFGIPFGLLVLLIFVFGRNDTPTPASTPAPASGPASTKAQEDAKRAADQKEERFQRAVLGAKQLKTSMRNPDAFKLSEVLMMDDGAVCYTYRAQNGFGGVNVGQAVLSPKGRFKSNESDGFRGLWNKECANKMGIDETWKVGYAAGLHGILSDN